MSSKLAIVCALACVAATLPALAAGETERPDTLVLRAGLLELDALRVDAPLALVTHTGAALVRVHGELVIDAPLSARSATRAPGHDGADLVLEADRIVLTANGTLRAEDGARGADAIAWDGSDALALPGGAGGDILLRAPSITLDGALQPGRGGDGGHALAYRGGDATGGAGGPSGVALAHDAHGPRLVGGADGGDGGDAVSFGDALDVTRMCAPPRCGMPGGVDAPPTPREVCTEDGRCLDFGPNRPCVNCTAPPAPGGLPSAGEFLEGPAVPSPGGPLFEPGEPGEPGSAPERCAETKTPPTPQTQIGDGGNGGSAFACGADGGDGASGKHGHGGLTCGPGARGADGTPGSEGGTATGGAGGAAIKGRGGQGGDGVAKGGNGGAGGSGGSGGKSWFGIRCAGGDGGNGGKGGDGGNGNGGRGGDAYCGVGGDGGRGIVTAGSPGGPGAPGEGAPRGNPGSEGAQGIAGAALAGTGGSSLPCGPV